MYDAYMELYTELNKVGTTTLTEDSPSNHTSTSCWCHQFTLYNDSVDTCMCQTSDSMGSWSVASISFDEYAQAVVVHEKLRSQDHYFQNLMSDMSFVFSSTIG